MELYIDSSKAEKIIIRLDNDEIVAEAHKNKSQLLLKLIADSLEKKGFKARDIHAIKVERGPGSFTGLRVGLSVANTLGWALGVNINGKNIKKDGPVLPVYK